MDNLTDLLSEFQRDHPEVALMLESIPVDQLILPRSNGKFDMVINQSIMFQNHDELELFHFTDTHYIFIISRDYPVLRENPEAQSPGYRPHDLSAAGEGRWLRRCYGVHALREKSQDWSACPVWSTSAMAQHALCFVPQTLFPSTPKTRLSRCWESANPRRSNSNHRLEIDETI